ncbi:MAG: DUF3857 domain-containing protein [Chloracidobacterium sp.]|nr:DUF3857 domain-containing protein [Chloracidobacterium sp.]
MRTFPKQLLLSASLLLTILLIGGSVQAQDNEWRPISSGEIAQKTPIVDADADAEAIFWEVRIDDSSSDELSRKHYVRVKIFTERGREKYSKFDITYSKGTKIKDLAARVIRADGTIVDIKKEEIFDREIVRANGVKVKARSFAVPNIEPGVIVEYRYKETVEDASAMGMKLQFQRDIPVQNLVYYYKPYNDKAPQTQPYNLKGVEFVKDKGGYYLATRTNVPALKEEPRMPPDDMVRAWMLLTGTRFAYTFSGNSLTYAVKDPSNVQKYWAGVAGERSSLAKFILKKDSDIRKAAEEITAGAQTTDEKLQKLYEYCQSQISNTTFDATLTDEQRAKLPEIKSLADVLKRKSASSPYIDMVFGAMASSLGLETRVGLVGDRSQMFFHPNMANDRLIHVGLIGVNVVGAWKLFNPGMKFLPYGMLVWYEEDNWALLVSDKSYSWEQTPFTPQDRSNITRNGKFKLLEDGSLVGDVVMEYSGHPALSYRSANYDESAAKREEDLKTEIKARLSTAEISNVSIENVDDIKKTLTKKYTVKVPNYAQKTGKRIFVQPGFFEYGVSPLFKGSSRTYDIFFSYPWSETDSVEIDYPAAYDLDNADAPGAIFDSEKIASLDIKIGVDAATHFLKYERKFFFGGGGKTLFRVESYPALKGLFDNFHKSDTHTITLKQR